MVENCKYYLNNLVSVIISTKNIDRLIMITSKIVLKFILIGNEKIRNCKYYLNNIASVVICKQKY